MLHQTLGETLFFKNEIVEVEGLLTGLLVTYDGVSDDTREPPLRMDWDTFLKRMSMVKPDWKTFDRASIEKFAEAPDRVMMGYEGRTIYFIKGGAHPEQWTPNNADTDGAALIQGGSAALGRLIQYEVETLRQRIPSGHEHFRMYEDQVRVIFNFLFRSELGDGKAQSRTEPEDDGVEIRDLIFTNKATAGFWKDLKDKYSATEVIVDAKNKDVLTREDLRQLYCYLKRALGFWGFIVCRSPPSEPIKAFNRTLHKNFSQLRGVLVLSDDDLHRMVQIANRGRSPSAYLQERMADFARSI
jgi:hypothetical protein